MQLDSKQIDLVVRRVISRLTDSSAPTTDARAMKSMRFEQRLFCAGDVVEGVSEVIVAAGTVFTPLALDELRARRVSVRRLSRDGNSKSTGAMELIDDTACQQKTVEQIANHALSIVESRGSVIVVSVRPHQLVCSLNRKTEIRAALIHGRGCIAGAEHQLKPNTWVVDAASSRQGAVAMAKHIEKIVGSRGRK